MHTSSWAAIARNGRFGTKRTRAQRKAWRAKRGFETATVADILGAPTQIKASDLHLPKPPKGPR